MMKKAHSAIPIRIISMALAVAGALMFMPMDTYADVVQEETTQADISFKSGNLSLLTVPNISFGTDQPISGETQDYIANTISEKIKISDLRGGGRGWHVKAKLSGFKSSMDADTLSGASISFAAATITPVAEDNRSSKPTSEAFKLTAGSEDATKIISAAGGEGLGDWELEWLPADIKLTVLAGTARSGMQTATITWILEDVA